MRVSRGALLGGLLVALYALALVVVTLTANKDSLRRGDRGTDDSAAIEFIDAWERARTATFVRLGTYARRSEVTGSEISSKDVLAQRPPRRLHWQLGGMEGRDDRRLVLCPSTPEEGPPGRCTVGEPAGPTFAQDVASEVAALRSLLAGDLPVYVVARDGDTGCFDLVQRRIEPRAPFGSKAWFCFDEATGAPSNNRVTYAGGIVEAIVVTEIRAEVTDEDLRI